MNDFRAREIPEKLREAVRIAIAEAIGVSAYDCTRVWEAWNVGTMDQDDFVPIIEDDSRIDEIANAAINQFLELQCPQAVPVSEKPLTDEQIIERLRAESENRASDLWNSLIRAKVPVPVSEKPWERPGWCDKRGRCWWSAGNVVTALKIDFEAQLLPMSWWLVSDPESCITGKMLPFDAIPLFDRNNKTGGEQ